MEPVPVVHVLQTIQSRLVAPKSQFNSFGNYKYRNCEDILEALKPLLAETGCSVVVSDEVVQVGDRFYVKATAYLFRDNEVIASSQAFAREPLDRKGMDASQITGATSSYARKYALNGLFAIDDSKDPDSTNVTVDAAIKPVNTVQAVKEALQKGNGAAKQPIPATNPAQATSDPFDEADEAIKAFNGELVPGFGEKTSLLEAAVGQIVPEVELLVKAIRFEPKRGKSGMTFYKADDAAGAQFIIQKWGAQKEEVKGALCTFFEVKVGEFKGERQYTAEKVVAK